MASGFIKRHKRKSLLAALVLLLKGRAKYVIITLVVVAASLPFVISKEVVNRMLEVRVVASVLRAMGMDGFLSTINPGYSGEFLKTVMDKAVADSARSSYWSRFMGAVNPAIPCGAGCGDNSSMAMIRGGAELYRSRAGRGPDGKQRGGPGEVTGVVSAEEQARGEGPDAVDLEGMLGAGPEGKADGPGGPGGGTGFYGDVMGLNLAERYSGGPSGGSGPYVNRSLLSRPGGVVDRRPGGYYNPIGQPGNRIPVPGRAKKVPAKLMGRASGFSWRNVGYTSKRSTVNKTVGSKRPMFQLAETFSVGNSAFKSLSAAYEYQAAYVGATYDGNDINHSIIQPDGDPPPIPPTGFIDDLHNAIAGQQLAKECAKAQSVHGTKMADDADEMDRLSQDANPPKCYENIMPWNMRVSQQGQLCQDFNLHQTELARACQTTNTPMDCSIYYKDTKSGGMVISKCKKPSGIMMIFMMLLLIVLLVIAILAVILGPLIAFIASLFAYIAISSTISSIKGKIAAAEALYRDKMVSIQDAKKKFER
ncbi:MAG: hypothetical protein WCW52_10640 [Elusimicrobiales bacterium]|jgi:hypothetical protein